MSKLDIPCDQCGCSFNEHEKDLQAIQRVRDLIESVNVKGYANRGYELGIRDLSKVILKALDGEQE